MPGILYVVATPIGNLEDITLRALRVLKEADLIACEDTRHTRLLLQRHGIGTPTTSYFEHNKLAKGPHLVALLRGGKSIALVTDAGTPGISDPGFHLVRLAQEAGAPVVPVPGPSALMAALSASGVPADRFVFEGFLPIKAGRRVNRLKDLRAMGRTVVLYESPHRIGKTLEAIHDVWGDVEVILARELTKQHEEILRSRVSELLTHGAVKVPRGEFVVLIPARSGAERKEADRGPLAAEPVDEDEGLDE